MYIDEGRGTMGYCQHPVLLKAYVRKETNMPSTLSPTAILQITFFLQLKVYLSNICLVLIELSTRPNPKTAGAQPALTCLNATHHFCFRMALQLHIAAVASFKLPFFFQVQSFITGSCMPFFVFPRVVFCHTALTKSCQTPVSYTFIKVRVLPIIPRHARTRSRAPFGPLLPCIHI